MRQAADHDLQTGKRGAKVAGEKTKEVGAEVCDKAGDVKDTTVKGTKVAAEKTKAIGVRATGSPEHSKNLLIA